MLSKTVERILEDHGYRHCEWSGCFDIAANKRDNTCLIKILDNIDSIQEDQASNLRMLSCSFSAFATIIGTHTRKDMLEDDVVYERYGVPAITANTFNNILDEKHPLIYRTRGGLFSEIDNIKLRKYRRKNNLSQKQLAERIGVTKKFIYEHEKRQMMSDREIVMRLESALKEIITSNIRFELETPAEGTKPASNFESIVCKNLRKMGFVTSTVHQTPFNIIAKEGSMVLSSAEDSEKKIRKNMSALKNFSKLTKNPAVIISKNKKIESELPLIDVKELPGLTINDFKKIVKCL